MNNFNAQLRQILVLLVKYHFWILCALAVAIGTVFWFVASSRLARATEERRSQLQQAREQVIKVRSVADHPNTRVITAIRQEHRRLIDIVYRAWEELYRDQRERNQWPRQLGAEFLNVINSLGPDDEIPVQYREIYQYFIKNHFPEWYDIIDLRLPPKRDAQGQIMRDEHGRPLKEDPFERSSAGRVTTYGTGYRGAATYAGVESEYVGETAYTGSTVGSTARTGPRDDRIGTVEWNLQDLQRIRAQFDWPTTPTTFEVRLAQENLWVYEALLWIIRETNAGATSYYNAPIKRIESLQIGQEAAVSLVAAQSRLFGATMFAASAGAPGAGPGMGSPGGLGGMMTMPGMPMGGSMMLGMGSTGYYPGDYYGAEGGPEGGMMAPGMPAPAAAAPRSQEEMIRQRLTHFRYVDKEGKPLRADEPHPFAEFKMMPVRMLLYMDQRRIPRLLVNCANSPMPVQVRAVSLRPGQGRQVNLGTMTGPVGSAYPGMGSMMGPTAGGLGAMGPYGGAETYPGGTETYVTPGYGDTASRTTGDTGSVDLPVEVAGIIFIFNPPERSKVGKLGEAEAPGAVGMPSLEEALSSMAQPQAPPAAGGAATPPEGAPAAAGQQPPGVPPGEVSPGGLQPGGVPPAVPPLGAPPASSAAPPWGLEGQSPSPQPLPQAMPPGVSPGPPAPTP